MADDDDRSGPPPRDDDEREPVIIPFPKLHRFQPIIASEWQDTEPRPVEWIVQNCVPARTVCMFSGDGGIGKSYLAQQMQTACGYGLPWLGHDTKKVRTLGLYCEDPEEILHARQLSICKHYEREPSELEDYVALMSCVGIDNTMIAFRNERSSEGKMTILFDQIEYYCREYGIGLLIIDTVAQVFAGNENNRGQVTQFVNALHNLVQAMSGGAVVITSHPSDSGLASGKGYSGSTAWRATVRAHIYLKRARGYDDEDANANHNERILKTMKSNWGAGHGFVRLEFRNGAFAPMIGAQPSDHIEVGGDKLAQLVIEKEIGDTIDRAMLDGDRVAASKQAKNNIHALSRRHLRHYRRSDIETALDRMLAKKTLIRVTVKSSQRKMYVCLRKPEHAPYPSEIGEATSDEIDNADSAETVTNPEPQPEVKADDDRTLI